MTSISSPPDGFADTDLVWEALIELEMAELLQAPPSPERTHRLTVLSAIRGADYGSSD